MNEDETITMLRAVLAGQARLQEMIQRLSFPLPHEAVLQLERQGIVITRLHNEGLTVQAVLRKHKAALESLGVVFDG